MFERFLSYFQVTKGQQCILIAYGAVMIASVGLIYTILHNAGTLPADPDWGDVRTILICAALSGPAMFFARNWMGKEGFTGFVFALVAAAFITLYVSITGGTLVSLTYGLTQGPIFLFSEFVVNPLLAIAWLAIMFEAHQLIKRYRRERNLKPSAAVLTDNAVSSFTKQNLSPR